jgi:transposase
MRCEEPMKIIEMLRLWEQNYSQRDIARSVNCSKTTVGELQKRCRAAGLSYTAAAGISDDAIQGLLYPDRFGGRPVKQDPDWEGIQKRLDQGGRLNLRYLWEEYREANPKGLGYSQFCARYGKWRHTTGKQVVMVQEHEPGKELFVDWAGDTLECVLDSETGKLLKAHFFVAALGDSGYPVVEAFPDEKLESWLTAHVHSFQRIGGVPRVIVPDNCKTAVSKANYYDPEINRAYYDLAVHYGAAVIPARVRAPQDKSIVEGTVGWLETWLVEWLRGQQPFTSFAELNGAIRKRLAELVKRPYQKRAGSRESVFRELDQGALRPLPEAPYEYAVYQKRYVPANYHVEYAGFYYSVSHEYYRQEVTLKASSAMIEVYDSQRRRIALHERRFVGHRYVTVRSHMPASHQFQQDQNRFDGKRYRQWVGQIGPNTYQVIDSLLRSNEVEETAYRSCMAILQLGKKVGNDCLEAACRKARELHSGTYTTIKTILKNHQEGINSGETVSITALAAIAVEHENLRGPAAFV